MSRRRNGAAESIFEVLAQDPNVRAFAEHLAFGVVAPSVRRTAQAARRAYRFPACVTGMQTQRGLVPCGVTGIGHCENCQQPFCAGHGLVLLSPVLDPNELVAEVSSPLPGCCVRCFTQGKHQQPLPHAPSSRDTTVPPGGWVPPPGSHYGPAEPQQGPRPIPPRQAAASPAMPPPQVVWAYVTLELPVGASANDVNDAYRRLSKERHPDKPGGSDEAMKILNKAKGVLTSALGGG